MNKIHRITDHPYYVFLQKSDQDNKTITRTCVQCGLPISMAFAVNKEQKLFCRVDDFCEECCVFDSYAVTPVKTLRQAYDNWVLSHELKGSLSPRKFNDELRKKGLESGSVWFNEQNQKCWTGIDLRKILTKPNRT